MADKDPAKQFRTRRALDEDLDRLEGKIAELRVLYEQYFVDVMPQPPTKLQEETVRMIRTLLRAPFKNSANRFRLRVLISRYQTYATYWERVNKQKEEGTYSRDLFKADMREKAQEDAKLEHSRMGAAERGLKQLYDSYEAALKKAGGQTANMNFDSFKSSLMKKAKQMKEQHGVKKLHYKVVVKDGKVVVKASPKE